MSRIALFTLCVLSFVPLLALGIDVGAKGHHRSKSHGQKSRLERSVEQWCSEANKADVQDRDFCTLKDKYNYNAKDAHNGHNIHNILNIHNVH